MAYWLRSGVVGKDEIKDEVRQQSFSPGRKWTQISSSQVKEIERNKAAQKAKAYYEPGGGFGKGVEAGLERERTQAMSSGMQALVGSGFAGTTMAGGLGKKFAEEVGMPTRARIEETRGQAISGIEMMLAEMAQQSGQASAQRGFQARQSQADRELQKYLANLQAGQRMGPTMRAGPTQTRPQTGTTMRSGGGGGGGGGSPSATGAGAALYNVGAGYTPQSGDYMYTDLGPGYPVFNAGSGDATKTPTMAPLGDAMYGSQEAFERNIPGQYTPSAMDEYLRTYTPQPGDFSTFSWKSVEK